MPKRRDICCKRSPGALIEFLKSFIWASAGLLLRMFDKSLYALNLKEKRSGGGYAHKLVEEKNLFCQYFLVLHSKSSNF